MKLTTVFPVLATILPMISGSAIPEPRATNNASDSAVVFQDDWKCESRWGTTASVADVDWCISYLADKGTEPCEVGPGPETARMCTHRSATIIIYATDPNRGVHESSWCHDIAWAAKQIREKCPGDCASFGRCWVGGSNTAWWNPHITVDISQFNG